VSCHRALIGAIPKSLRGLTIDYEKDGLYWKAYFDGVPSEEEKEVLSVACTEVIADFSEIMTAKEEYLFCPYPQKMDRLKMWIFLRWEDETNVI